MPLMMATNAELASATLSEAALSLALVDLTSSALPDSCEVRRREYQDDGQGTYAQVWLTVFSAVPCLLESMTLPAEKVKGDVLLSTADFELKVSVGLDLQPFDVAVIRDQLYHVMDTNKGETGLLFAKWRVIRIWNWPNV